MNRQDYDVLKYSKRSPPALSQRNSTALAHKKALSCKRVKFIHVGKNGGTTVEAFFKGVGKSFAPQQCCGHSTILSKDQSTCYVTLIRDPMDRWVSGYLSRFRSGCPSHCSRNIQQEWVWKAFPSPNHLAEAFSSPDKNYRALSLRAHAEILHLKQGFAYTFVF